jgi:hypothetical protein
MHAPPDVTLRTLRRYLLLEAWTWSTPEQAAGRRAEWPAWRRAVRPVGAIAWWAAVAIALLTTPYDGNSVTPAGQLFVVLWLVIAACIAVSVIDGMAHRRPGRPRTIPPRERHDVHSA